jgi:cellulose synthase/poly-beta-1,6-N-acetylglucosamine synthase-like glycosyltransferase
MAPWQQLILYTYFAILALLSVYGGHRLLLIFLYYRHRHHRPMPKEHWQQLPTVTVQLPIYNEATVVQRLLEAVAALNYPRDRLEIQVLDDSVDETQRLAQEKVQELQRRGLDVKYLHRSKREGFKAGALAAGLPQARGEFIAIFDADFVPDPQMLAQTVHHFTDREVGMVQVRWGHLNRDFSVLTRLQSMLLDGHFVVEHTARNRSGRHFNFNGTAGIWRREAIVDAGGWQGDTLTEDLDLSYRAQIRGWRFTYLLDETSPGELPVEMTAFKTQQHRWAKGSIQTSRKLLPTVWRSPLPLKVKIEATFHLTANLSYPLLLTLCLLMLPALQARLSDVPSWRTLAFDVSVLVLATLSVLSFYVVAQREIDGRWRNSLKYLPGLISLGVGLAVNNARAVLEALFSHSSPFVRTPKYAVRDGGQSAPRWRYHSLSTWATWLELAFGTYMTVVLFVAVRHRQWPLAVFLLLFAGGFFYVGLTSLCASSRMVPPPVSATPRVSTTPQVSADGPAER